ncbi:MAG: hypothetical protein WD824_09620 [Cyclobacteriaceae bacterium]
MLELATNRLPKLTAIATLYDALHENAIVYCNLKGNEKHLRVSVTGESDIDILFDENQKGKIEPILGKLGYKKFDAIKPKQYRDIVDFLTLDLESGKVIHLHTHYRLTIGEPFLKGYQLDIENYILNDRVFNEEFGMYCIRPVFELILLYLTESLKLRHRDLILMYLKGNLDVSQKTIYEYTWLKKRTTDDELEACLKQVFNDHINIFNLFRADFNRKQLQRLAPVLKKEFEKYRLYSPLRALLLRWYREATMSVLRKLSRILTRPILSMRINPRGGVIVAVTGIDQVSQSNVINLLNETFRKKMDVYSINFQKRDDNLALISFPLFKLFRRENPKLKTNSPGKKESWFLLLYKFVGSLVVAHDNWNKIRRAQTAKKKGALVICNGYPGNQIPGDDNGPVHFDLPGPGSFFLRILATIESKMYARTERYFPDILFHLVGGPEGIESRKAGETAPCKDLRAAKQVSLNGGSKVITIPAAKPVKDLLYILKRDIWNIL